LRLIRRKRKVWRKVKRSKTAEDMAEYRSIEKEVSNKIRNVKRKLEKELVTGPDKNNRKFTKYVKSKTKSRTTVGPLITKDKKVLTEEKDMAEELNSFFSSVFTKEDLSQIPDPETEVVQRNMDPVRVCSDKIRKQIRKLRKEAAPGPDGIKPSLLKQLEDSFLLPLELLFSKSLETGEIPHDWKTAKVTPIFKKGAKGDPGNYRPVSLTSVPCKILESILKEEIMNHLLDNKLIRDSQHGFMPGKSCATNLVLFMDKVTKAVDEGKAVDIFYLDFAKAFDKVPRQRLVKKLRAKGVEEKTVTWIENWLSGRTQRVCIKGEQSDSCPVESGVPQGTVLGPTLFTVYIDDLDLEVLKRMLSVWMVKFADDTKGGKIIENDSDREELQMTLDLMCDWADTWGMSFNISKCKIMHVGKNNPCYEYTMRGVKLGVTEEERDIGVVITKNLKPSEQCSKAAGRATAVLNQLKRNFHYRDRHTFMKLYKQYVRPHLEFSSPAWSPWAVGDKENLERVQEKAVKMVAGLKSREYKDRCKELGLETLEERREKQDVALVHKLVLSGQHGQIFSLAGNGDRPRTRQAGGEHRLLPQFARTDPRKFSFAVRAVDPWNGLPDEVKMAANKEEFRARRKRLKN
jgi:hypothetical protein